MKKIFFCLFFLLSTAHAERADSFQKTVIKARDISNNTITKVATLTGEVEIQRGSILIRAEHAVLSEDAEGYQHLVMTTQPGEKAVTFRQKRDGPDDQWMEGEAQQVTYDEKTEVVDLIDQARTRRTTQGVVTDEATGEHIVYQSREEQYFVTQLPGKVAAGDRRAVMVLEPARKDALNKPVNSNAAANLN